MKDDETLLIAAWISALGTNISAIAEVRGLIGMNERNDRLELLGEALQAVGAFLAGTVTTDDPLNFTGNWIDGVGAAGSSLATYLGVVGDSGKEDDKIRLGILGDTFQSMGSAISALADHSEGEHASVIANSLESLGAGLGATGGIYDLQQHEKMASLISTIGAIIQATGANYNAIIATKVELTEKSE